MGFRAAEGYVTLELWQEALDELSEMPQVFRNSPAVFRLELRACVALGSWERGEAVALRLGTMGALDRMMAAGFHAAQGRELLRQNRREEALRVLRRAVETWPSCKDVVLKDPELVAAML
jgi:Flp pilus assembly protein TadD